MANFDSSYEDFVNTIKFIYTKGIYLGGKMEEESLVGGGLQEEDMQIENSLRPHNLREYVGQQALKDQLMEQKKERQQCLCFR